MSVKLVKLAVKRDQSVPVGQPAPLHLDCPCGTVVPIVGNINRCVCGVEYTAQGWIVQTQQNTTTS